MDLSRRWLSEFVDIDVDDREFAEAMTMSGSKVEGYTKEGEEISNVVVGRVLSIERHPDADKLVVCQIDVGEKNLQIVTGASNLTVGDLVPVALDGSTLPGGVKIKKGKLRGIESFGMMCSIAELGVTTGDFPYAVEDGIMILHEDCKPGDDIKDAIGLNDTVVEFEITSNRPDCLSVIGLAREAAATFEKPFRYKEPEVEFGGGKIDELLDVRVDAKDLCKRYMARVIKNVKIEPSPRWMRERLRASGVRPINNIVDITNYVMLEYGQPMHAFDYRLVDGGNIIVRRAAKGEKITTLDGVERELSEKMLVIADKDKPVAVAGVMGGEFSGIVSDTSSVVFESACFDGASVRTTAKSLGMRTDASSRYEKGLPYELCAPALDRACELVTLLGAGEVVNGTVDCIGDVEQKPIITLDDKWTNKFLGTDIPKEKMVSILEQLGFTVNGDEVTPPYFRIDIAHKADVAEEIARFYGYDIIPETAIRGSAQGRVTAEQHFERKLNDTMLALGFSQIMTYSFISPKMYDKIMMPSDDTGRKSVVISNPLGEDTSIMRTTVLPSMLDILSGNYNDRNKAVRLFELASEYKPKGENELPDEPKKLVIGAYGDKEDFFTIKGAVEDLLDELNVYGCEFEAVSDRYAYHPGRCAAIVIGDREIGVMGEIHPKVAENFSIGTKVYAAVIDFDLLMENSNSEKSYKPMPKFPSVTRDLAIICDRDLPVSKIEKIIKIASGNLLESVELFDVYTGSQIPEGQKSVAYSFTLRSESGTLTDKQSDKVVKKIVASLDELGAKLRG